MCTVCAVMFQPKDRNEHVITQTWESGVYLFIIQITPTSTDDASVDYKAAGEDK